MVGELLAASPSLPKGFGLHQFQENMRALRHLRQFHHLVESRNLRGWVRRGVAPRMDSLVFLSLHQDASMLCLLTKRIADQNPIAGQNSHAHHLVDGPTVEDALRLALREDFPPPVSEVAARLGYGNTGSLLMRFRDLCQAISRKRRANFKPSPPLPRERIEKALREALEKDKPVPLFSLAFSIGLRNKKRLYKSFRDLSNAVVENNRRLRQAHAASIESALRAALEETPVPSLTALSRRLGFRCLSALPRRFPELAAQLKQRRQMTMNN
jgi:hypothetical protein